MIEPAGYERRGGGEGHGQQAEVQLKVGWIEGKTCPVHKCAGIDGDRVRGVAAEFGLAGQ